MNGKRDIEVNVVSQQIAAGKNFNFKQVSSSKIQSYIYIHMLVVAEQMENKFSKRSQQYIYSWCYYRKCLVEEGEKSRSHSISVLQDIPTNLNYHNSSKIAD